MHARVVTVHSTPGRLNDAISIYEESVIPEAKKRRGFINGYLLVNVAQEQAVSIVLWDTEEDMVAGDSTEYVRSQLAKFGPIFSGQPLVEHYEVRVAV